MPGDGCLVAWVIDRGKPLARAVGPVVAEPGPSAACVLLHDETVGHRAFVDHADLCAVAGDVERDIYLAALVLRGNTSAVHVDRTHRKAINEVEAYSLQTGGAPQRHHDIAVDVGARVGQFEGDVIVERVDARLIRGRRGNARCLCAGRAREGDGAEACGTKANAHAGSYLKSRATRVRIVISARAHYGYCSLPQRAQRTPRTTVL